MDTLHAKTHDAEDAASAAMRELVGMFWDSPFPTTVQDAAFRLVAVNDAYVQFTGHSRERLLGTDPVDLQPPDDRERSLQLRRRIAETPRGAPLPPLLDLRLVDAGGRTRWFRAVRRQLPAGDGDPLYMTVLQDCSAEHAAREQADRSARDLDQWFDISRSGMVLFDDAGLLLRTNPAFEALIGTLPVSLAEASPVVQQLLGWEGDAPSARLEPGAAALERSARLVGEAGTRRVRALVRCYKTPGGQRRYMAAVDDMSAEDERDLARLQIGAMVETAGVDVATFQESGWMSAGHALRPPPNAPGLSREGSLQAIGREMVQDESLADYEAVQQALRQGQRAEARYAIRHPELGLRWLLTRVEPGQLASGRRTLSVVTLDVTDQQQARLHNEQLLRELGTILESSPAGIVYLRGEQIVRCNRRFERMIGVPPDAAMGRSVRELLAGVPTVRDSIDAMLQAIAEGRAFEAEFATDRADGTPQWWSLLVRSECGRGEGAADGEAVGMLSDITRLKAQQTRLEALSRDRELMFNLSDVGIAFIRDGRIEGANESMRQLTGHDARQLAGLPLAELFRDAGEFDAAWSAESAALRRRGRWSGERELRRRDGSLLWVQVSKRLVREGDPSGGAIASYVNVDDRHRAEASLAQQAERMRAVLDSVLVGIVTVGRDGIAWMNRPARRMFGGDLSDFVGQPLATVATPEADHPFRRTRYLDELVESQAATFECRVKARDGREFWIAGNAVVTVQAHGERQLTYALLDIDRRREAEARTAEARASLQRIIELAPLAITVHDAATLRVLQANPAAQTLTGRAPEYTVGRTPEELYPAPVAERLRDDMRATCAGTTATRHEYAIGGGESLRVWEARMLPLAAAEGAPADQLLLIAADITEQRAAEQARLDAAIAQREMLVREVHHRIKNNLQGVAGLLQQTATRRPEVAAILGEVVGQVQAIAQVYGLQVGASGPLRVRSVVDAIAGAVQRSFGRDIRLSVEGEAEAHRWALPEAESIPIALTLNELLNNAVKHGSDASIDCALHFDGTRGVRIVITNAGRLPDGFDVDHVAGGVSGLGLVRALLPRRSATLSIEQHGARVVTCVALRPPGVTLLALL